MIHVHVGTIYTLEIPLRGMFQTPLLELDWEYQELPWHNPAPSYFRKTSSSYLLLCPRLSLHSDAHFLLLSLCFRTFFGLILHTPKRGVDDTASKVPGRVMGSASSVTGLSGVVRAGMKSIAEASAADRLLRVSVHSVLQ
ncbi:hypothetical protein KQX54_008786 [Cotesia glomerata]|uniref:Uncharacterized protein n=1 Tax=Cotesia glomerata TaxID=32391 RepID=A0AAV7IAG6_COTGL|nr:hypothetical protein KQX54_008786 [Cotesia glomerata]